MVGVPRLHLDLLFHLGLSEAHLRKIGLYLLLRLLPDDAGLVDEGLCCYLLPRGAAHAHRRTEARKTAEIHALVHAHALLHTSFVIMGGSVSGGFLFFLEIRRVGD